MGERRELRMEAGDAARLLAACCAGDPGALDRFYRDHVDRVTRVIARLIGPSPDVEDLVQATFIEALQSLTTFRGEASLSTWVVRIGVHVVAHHLRRGVRRPAPLQLLSDHDEPGDAAAPADRQLDAGRLAHRVHALLDRIAPKKRIAFLLHVMEGYSVEEVAALTGASRAATKSRIWFARRELLKLARHDPALRDLAITAPPEVR
jgi:RNA polymerase sigma-70 factor (ECF subfamily)